MDEINRERLFLKKTNKPLAFVLLTLCHRELSAHLWLDDLLALADAQRDFILTDRKQLQTPSCSLWLSCVFFNLNTFKLQYDQKFRKREKKECEYECRIHIKMDTTSR